MSPLSIAWIQAMADKKYNKVASSSFLFSERNDAMSLRSPSSRDKYLSALLDVKSLVLGLARDCCRVMVA